METTTITTTKAARLQTWCFGGSSSSNSNSHTITHALSAQSLHNFATQIFGCMCVCVCCSAVARLPFPLFLSAIASFVCSCVACWRSNSSVSRAPYTAAHNIKSKKYTESKTHKTKQQQKKCRWSIGEAHFMRSNSVTRWLSGRSVRQTRFYFRNFHENNFSYFRFECATYACVFHRTNNKNRVDLFV